MAKGKRNRTIARAAANIAENHGGSWRTYARAVRKGRPPLPKIKVQR